MAGKQEAGGPLKALRVLVTRPRHQADRLTTGLEELGAKVLSIPTIRIEPPLDDRELRRAAASVATFDWVVFTSANGVRSFWESLLAEGGSADSMTGVSTCAIGTATARSLAARGIRVDLIPPKFVAEEIVTALGSGSGVAGRRILLPRAERGRQLLPDLLSRAGAEVEEVTAYRTVTDRTAAEEIRSALRSGGLDLVVFTSGSTVEGFVDLAGVEPKGFLVASIGPITSAVARERGLSVAIEAAVHDTEGLISAIREHFS